MLVIYTVVLQEVVRKMVNPVGPLNEADLDIESDPARLDVESNAILGLHSLDVGVVGLATLPDGRAGAVSADSAAGNKHVVVHGDQSRAVSAGPTLVASVLKVDLGPVAGILTEGSERNLVGSKGADGLGVVVGSDSLGLAGLEHEDELLVGLRLEHAGKFMIGAHLVGTDNLVGLVSDVLVERHVVVHVDNVKVDEHHVGVPFAAVVVTQVAGVHNLLVRNALALVVSAERLVLGLALVAGSLSRRRSGSGGNRGLRLGLLRLRGRLGDRNWLVDVLEELLRGGGGVALLVVVTVKVSVARRVGRRAENAGKEKKMRQLHVD